MKFQFQLGPWVPDLANVAIECDGSPTSLLCADCLNVYYADGTYKTFPAPVNQSGEISGASPVLGALTTIDPSGMAVVYAWTAAAFYVYTGSGWTAISTGAGPIGGNAGFSACQFMGNLYAMPQILNTDVNQYQAGLYTWPLDTTSSATIVQINNTVPTTLTTSNVIAPVGQFLFIGDVSNLINTTADPGSAFIVGNGSKVTFTVTLGFPPIRRNSLAIFVGGALVGSDNGLGQILGAGIAAGSVNYGTGAVSVTFATAPPSGSSGNGGAQYYQAAENRVMWSAIGNGQNWPQPLTNAALAAQSGYEDVESELGAIMAICGYPLYALIFQQTGITRAIYQGGNVVFSFGTYEFKRGLVARNAYVQVGPNVYFLSDQGFFSTDGANVYPIGTAQDNSAGIDNWFWANVDRAALGTIFAGYDAASRSVMFAVPLNETGSLGPCNYLLIYNLLAQRWTKAAISSMVVWTDSDGTRHRLGVIGLDNVSGYPYQLLTGTGLTGYVETCDTYFVDGNTRITTEVRPNIACTDTPTVSVGKRNTLQQAVSYDGPVAADSFGAGVAPFLSQGLYTRFRLTSTASGAMNGGTATMQNGGPV